MKYRWSAAPEQATLARHLSGVLGVSPLLAQCLLNRGLSEPEPIERFLEPRLGQLADPFLLLDMRKAVDRLWEAREAGEALVLFGDYDVDGVTATTLLSEVLRDLGWNVGHYLPHRFDEGYGLSEEGVENCLAGRAATLLVAVDCGSNAHGTIGKLKERGIDVVVLDHHQVSGEPPPARAVVNPQLAPPGEPSFRELCSAGLAFKLAHALVKHGREQGRVAELGYDIRGLLDLVALGTIADLVPVTGENRILIRAGLDRLNQTRRPGLLALKAVAGIGKELAGYEVGYRLGPRLNAAGRLENAREALELLETGDEGKALELARRLDSYNRQRQNIERAMVRELVEEVRAGFDPARDFVIVKGNDPWHIGVVGIVASRLVQEFHRPTIIMGADGDGWRGSGRSIEGFDLAAALRSCGDLLRSHGGHAMAAGIGMDPARLETFRERLNDLARRTLKPEQLQPSLRLDSRVGLGELSRERVEELSRLQPCGLGNPGVHFFARDLAHHRPLQRMGQEKQHVKMWVTDGGASLECVWWGAGQGELPTGRFDLAFAPKINEFRGRSVVQLTVLDWRPAV